jgi:RHS repeat-associated protein
VDHTAELAERITYSAYGEARHHWAADVDGDGDVDSADQSIISALAAGKGTPIDNPAYRAEADLNRDGIIDGDDVTLAGTTRGALGAGALSSAAVGNIVGYCGYLINDEIPGAGQYHVRHRVYDVALGRWLTRDPLGFVDGMNLYEYVGSRPGVRLDPRGLRFRVTWDALSAPPREARLAWNGLELSNSDIDRFDAISIASQAARPFTPNAAQGLRWYLENSGTTRYVKTVPMLVASATARNTVAGEVEAAARAAAAWYDKERWPNVSIRLLAGWQRPPFIPKAESLDWWGFFRGYQHASIARVSRTGPAAQCCLQLQLSNRVFKQYNFDFRDSFTIGGVTIAGRDLWKFHLAGMAQEYDIFAEMRATFNFCISPSGDRTREFNRLSNAAKDPTQWQDVH